MHTEHQTTLRQEHIIYDLHVAIPDLVLIELQLQFDHGFFAPLCSYAAAFAFALGFAFGLGFASRLAEAILSYTHPHVVRNDERIVRMLQAET